MPDSAETPFGRDELVAMQMMARRVWDADPSLCNGDASIGELAWSWASAAPERMERWRLRLEPGAGDAGLRGWGWSTGPEMIRVSDERWVQQEASLVWQFAPGEADLLNQTLDWFDDLVGDAPRWTRARSHDTESVAVIEDHGYTRDTDTWWTLMLTRPVADIEAPVVPEGYRLSTMAEVGDVESRVEVHRAAWHPSKQTVDTYTNVTNTWPYRADLDVVVVAPDGTLAASVLVWYDADGTGTGELEPVGTHPAHRRIGLAAAASLFAMQRLAAEGAERAAVSCRGDDNYPIPRRLYESVGFVEIARDWVFRKGEAPA